MRHGHHVRKGVLGFAVLLALLVGMVLASPASTGERGSPGVAAGATKKVRVEVPLPENGRQTFGVVKLRVKQGSDPGSSRA